MLYRFNDFELDSTNYSLKNNGKRLQLEPQVFDLIVYLIENCNRLVSRDEIFSTLWRDKEVLDATLSNHIKIARAVLGDDGISQNIIRTIRGRGYQFIIKVLKVEQIDDLPQSSPLLLIKYWKQLFSLSVIILLVTLLISFNSNDYQNTINKNQLVAVLPFLNSKPDPSTDYLGLAIADQIIGELIYLKNINVRPSSLIRKYKSQQIDPKIIGNQLNVDLILTGSYLSINGQIQFNIELIDVSTGNLLLREDNIKFDFVDPESLRNLILKKLYHKLANGNSAIHRSPRIVNKSQDALAYKLYLKSISQPFTIEGNKLAIQLLNNSISIDDNFAPAYSQLGNRIRRYEQYGLIKSESTLESFQYYEKALSINNQLLSALSYLAFYYCETNRLKEALSLANKIIQINPDSADSHFTLGYIYRYGGLLDESIKEMEKAVSIDPKNIRYRSLVATYSGVRDFKKAKAQLSNYEKTSFTLGWNGLLAYRTKDYKSSLDHFEKLKAQDNNGLWGLVSRIYIHYMKGEMQQGLLAIHELEQTNTTDSETVYYIAVYYGMYKDKQRSLNALKKAVNGGYHNYQFMQNSEFFDSFRSDSQFQEIVALAKRKSIKFRQQVTKSSGLYNDLTI